MLKLYNTFLIDLCCFSAKYTVLPDSDSIGHAAWGEYTYGLAECQAFCDQKPDCVGFVYKQKCIYTEYTCFPKASIGDIIPNSEGWYVYTKQTGKWTWNTESIEFRRPFGIDNVTIC